MCLKDVGTGVSLTETFRHALVQLHNDIRSHVHPHAADMTKMVSAKGHGEEQTSVDGTAGGNATTLLKHSYERLCTYGRAIVSLPSTKAGESLSKIRKPVNGKGEAVVMGDQSQSQSG